jgi:hypothetical protein
MNADVNQSVIGRIIGRERSDLSAGRLGLLLAKM